MLHVCVCLHAVHVHVQASASCICLMNHLGAHDSDAVMALAVMTLVEGARKNEMKSTSLEERKHKFLLKHPKLNTITGTILVFMEEGGCLFLTLTPQKTLNSEHTSRNTGIQLPSKRRIAMGSNSRA